MTARINAGLELLQLGECYERINWTLKTRNYMLTVIKTNVLRVSCIRLVHLPLVMLVNVVILLPGFVLSPIGFSKKIELIFTNAHVSSSCRHCVQNKRTG